MYVILDATNMPLLKQSLTGFGIGFGGQPIQLFFKESHARAFAEVMRGQVYELSLVPDPVEIPLETAVPPDADPL